MGKKMFADGMNGTTRSEKLHNMITLRCLAANEKNANNAIRTAAVTKLKLV
jgi:hypothetical protein